MINNKGLNVWLFHPKELLLEVIPFAKQSYQ